MSFSNNIYTYGAVAQLGARLNGIQEAEGSTPFSSTNFLYWFTVIKFTLANSYIHFVNKTIKKNWEFENFKTFINAFFILKN